MHLFLKYLVFYNTVMFLKYKKKHYKIGRTRTCWMLVVPEASFFTRKTGGSCPFVDLYNRSVHLPCRSQ